MIRFSVRVAKAGCRLCDS